MSWQDHLEERLDVLAHEEAVLQRFGTVDRDELASSLEREDLPFADAARIETLLLLDSMLVEI